MRTFFKKFPSLGRFSESFAAAIDKLELQEPKTYLGSFFNGVKKRAYFLGFTVAAAFDVIASFALATLNFVGALVTSDDVQQRCLQRAQTYSGLFSKSLLALIPFVWLAGLINPHFVTIYFTPADNKANEVKSGGGLYTEKVEKVSPTSIEEIQDLIRRAQNENRSVMVVGAGRSQGKQFIPAKKENESLLIDLSELNQVQVNASSKTITVGAGAKWHEIQTIINQHKLALKVMQASNVFSVGGSIGTNIHGWDHRSGNLAQVIKNITIVNAQGEIEVLDKRSPKFAQVMGGFGLFGVVVSAEIEVTANENLREKSKLVSIDQYVDHFRSTVQKDPNVKMHLFRLSLDPKNLLGEGVAVDYVKQSNRAVKTPNFHPEAENGTRFQRIMTNLARKSKFLRKRYWQAEKSRLVNNETRMTTNEVMQPPINAMFNNSKSESEWLQEYFLPETELAEFLKELAKILMINDVTLLNSSVRFVKQDRISPWSYAKDGDRFAVVLCFNQSLRESEVIKTNKWVREVNQLTLRHGGTFYLPYQQFATQEQVLESYPGFQNMQTVKREIDPNQTFASGLYNQYMKPRQNNYFKELLSNPQYRRNFVGFLQNVLQRVDAKKLYTLLDEILTYKDSHEEIYAELLKKLPEVMPGKINSLRRILSSLSNIKKDLGAQAKELLADVNTIDGLVEIGYPGRFVSGFQKHFKVKGPIVAAYEQPGMSDFIQTGFPRPYNKYVKLDYNMPDLSSLADNSADVVTCYVGLHHFSEDGLRVFLNDVRRVLRPGGHFLLVDHDCKDHETLVMANMAHSIFNAVAGTSVEEEMTEIRNFKSIDEWKAILAEHGLDAGVGDTATPMVRNGDPSVNTMVCFNKPNLPLQLTPAQQLDAAASAEAPASTPAPAQVAAPAVVRAQVPTQASAPAVAQAKSARSNPVVRFREEDDAEKMVAPSRFRGGSVFKRHAAPVDQNSAIRPTNI